MTENQETKPNRKATDEVLPTAACYALDIDAYGNEILEYKTISEGLKDNRIVSVKKTDEGLFRVREECDKFYRGNLTKDQLIAWGNELIDMANLA